LGSVSVPGSAWLNDIAVAADGTIYGTNTGAPAEAPDPATWQIWKIAPGGAVSLFVQGAPLFRPNGIEIDGEGHVVVVNMGNPEVITFATDGAVVRTQHAVQAGSDGIVIMPDGVKFVSSVIHGGISMIPLNGPPQLIAQNIPSAASMCYDSGANQLVVPLNANNGLAFISLEGIYRPRRSRR
jgi:sugar lactone lactonase YvrE